VSDGRGWTIFLAEDAAHVLETMRTTGHEDLHDHVVTFFQALTTEAGAAADAAKPLPGLPMGDGRFNVDVPHVPVLVSYSQYPGRREFRVTDLIWLG
jgi:hypothetical protein